MRHIVVVLLVAGLAGCAKPGRPVAFTKAVAVKAWATAAVATAPDEPVVKTDEPKADGKPASFWIGTMKDKDDKVRAGAVKSLTDIGGDAVPVLVFALKDSDVELRRRATKLLEELGQQVARQDAAIGLSTALQDADEQVRLNAAGALGYAASESKYAIEPLMVTLAKDQSDKVRARAAWALGHIGPDAREAVPALTAALKDKNDEVILNAFESLAEIGAASRGAVPALLDVFKEKGKSMPVDKIDSLKNIGPHATPILLEAIKLPDDDVRQVALENLADALKLPEDPPPELVEEVRKQTKSAVPGVVSLLKNDKATVRRKAAEVLGTFGAAAKEAAPTLKELLEDKEPAVREKAAEALKKIGE